MRIRTVVAVTVGLLLAGTLVGAAGLASAAKAPISVTTTADGINSTGDIDATPPAGLTILGNAIGSADVITDVNGWYG